MNTPTAESTETALASALALREMHFPENDSASVSVSLGGYMEQDEEARANPRGMVETLEADALRSLSDVVTTAAPWVRRFPTARTLDDEAREFSAPRASITPASSFLHRVQQAALIREKDAKVVGVALESGKADTALADKARGWGIRSVRNVGLAVLGLVGTVAAGYAAEVGTQIAQNSEVAHKIERLVVESETELLELLLHLPPDIRGALRAALDVLGKEGSSI